MTAHEMAARNPTRIQLVEKLEKLVETYNLGTLDVEGCSSRRLSGSLPRGKEEERRAAREGHRGLAGIFDLLTKPEPKLTKAQEVEVKKVARELLVKLGDHLNVFDWRSRQQTRAAVQSTIRFTLNELPEEPYPGPMWETKVDVVWAYIFSRSQVAQTHA